MAGLWGAWRRRREARALARREIPEALWQACIASLPFVATRPDEQLERLRGLVSLFLDRKEFSGVAGFRVSDDIAVSVAVQACLPVLELGIDEYDGFVGIVMHRDAVVAPREVVDEYGVVHAYEEELAGEAMPGGPLMLAWSDVLPGAHDEATGSGAYNVVIHEFAHVLDMRDGAADGVPLLGTAADRRAWLEVLVPEHDRFRERVVCGYESVIDAYGAESMDEFFAVASEAFFVAAAALMEEQPALYRLLASYYRQDPAQY